PTNAEQMAQAFAQVQSVLGTDSPIPDRSIRDALWDSYFDVDGTIAHLLDEQHKKEMAANRAAKVAAAAPPAPSSSSSAALSTPAPARAPDAAAAPAALPEKKLSKLQQKMLFARASRTQPGAAGGPAPPAAVEPAVPREDAKDAAPRGAPMALDEPPNPLFAAPSALHAPPSLFASALAPAPPPSALAPAAAEAHSRHVAAALGVAAGASPAQVAAFGPSPDDRVLEARKGTALKARLAKQARKAAAASQPGSAKSSRPATPSAPGAKVSLNKPAGASAGGGKSAPPGPVSALRGDMEALGLGGNGPSPLAREQEEQEERRRREATELEQAQQARLMPGSRAGHVDAGKSTLMGRVLHELGETSDKEIFNYQRQSEKIGKGSFAYAWTFDAMEEERERGVTIDVAIDSFETPQRRFTLIDAPGHRDFIPNMISGAAQADAAVLVVDGSNGGFEKGFEGGGQTREHAVLVRSLGVQQLIVAVNKLDTVGWSQKRFDAIRDALQPFLTQTGFAPAKVAYVPVGAMSGENLTRRSNEVLEAWYEGRSLVEELDSLDVPQRALEAPLRLPVSNVFKGQAATASGLAVTGRIESGIVQVGEKLAALPGDETGVVRALEVEGELVPYALAGSNVTVFLASIEANQLSVGSVLCPPAQPVPVVSAFVAQIIVFEPQYPITAGYAVELFHHSRDIPATIVGLEALLDKTTGQVTRSNPRMLTKNTSARIRVQLRAAPSAGRTAGIPLEPFSVNKGMGRVLFRRGGETVAAGIVLEVLQ
ncbi:hypothetical protein DMC30DRAFT_345421, partial [Rhodotorula diobovata]